MNTLMILNIDLMKTTKTMLIILIFYFGFLNNSLGQVLTEEKNQSPQELYDFHIDKMKTNKTAAWLALGGGGAFTIGGIVMYLTDNIWGDSSRGIILAGVGVTSSLISIPFFQAAGKHKSKAKIQLQNGAVGLNNEYSYSGFSITFSF
jgi:hypothetical protein